MSKFDPLTSIDMALTEISIACASLDRLAHAMTELRQSHLESRLPDLRPCDMPVTEHRRQHRSGVPSIIDSNQALQDFILTRIDRLT
ncbi:hypothetical protein PE067_09895 [Paracoccus sp. DMF-8]|uniref:hypothetical protein n=1 Tax=Paracoccus sp. DMF-8 TaxID=3019445 RepID=UPI0023E8068E|nr:hypothetical protein [Paracoccus sp. DMF-8]MDF3606425.1 hypothetical protein [Paracoccus sp. DMF-8]